MFPKQIHVAYKQHNLSQDKALQRILQALKDIEIIANPIRYLRDDQRRSRTIIDCH